MLEVLTNALRQVKTINKHLHILKDFCKTVGYSKLNILYSFMALRVIYLKFVGTIEIYVDE